MSGLSVALTTKHKMNTSQGFQNKSLNCCASTSSAPRIPSPLQGMDLETFNMSVTAFFTFIIFFGVLGNSLIFITISRWKNWRTSCNFLIANIAAADLGVVLIAAPQRIVERYYAWPHGVFLCNVVYPLQDVFVCVSVVTHSAIALERYRATVTPFKTRLSRKSTKLAIFIIWVGCYITSGLPQAIPGGQQGNKDITSCSVAVFSTPIYRKMFAIYLVVLFIATQLLIQTVAYAKIILTVKRKDDFLNMLTLQEESRGQRVGASFESRPSCTGMLTRARKTQKTVKLLLALVITFQLCHLPRGVLMLIHVFSPARSHTLIFQYTNLVSLAVYYLKHVINPVILYAMSEDFQNALKTCCTRTKDGKANSSVAQTRKTGLRRVDRIQGVNRHKAQTREQYESGV